MSARRVKKALFYLSLTAAAVYILSCAVNIYKIPREIRLTEYATHNLAFGMPFSATFQNGTAAVFKVNSTPVDLDITVSLQEPLIIETDGGGSADMLINAFGLTLKKVQLDIVPETEVVPCGMTVGVRINTDGVMVLGCGSFKGADGNTYRPCEGKLKPGDLILGVNGSTLKNKEELTALIARSEGEIHVNIQRDGEKLDAVIRPVEAARDNVRRIGVWVRDSTQGIGTITYYNPETNAFAALGHGIMDVDTKRLMSVKNGMIMASRVTAVKKGAKGTPGELEGAVERDRVLGQIRANSPRGIYGVIDPGMSGLLPTETVKLATQSLIHEGPASIRTNVASDAVMEYDIYIESVNRYAADETKGMIIRITDPELLKLTNGIVQGMSGSPILQDGRLIGAVTHVFVQEPAKGYGIFIEHMLKQEHGMN